jgi:hypothetical protein
MYIIRGRSRGIKWACRAVTSLPHFWSRRAGPVQDGCRNIPLLVLVQRELESRGQGVREQGAAPCRFSRGRRRSWCRGRTSRLREGRAVPGSEALGLCL